MENPNNKSGATKEQLRDYAQWRKDDEMKDIEKVKKDANSGKVESIHEHEEYREPLSIMKSTVVEIQLSWGGDGDGFLIEIDDNHNIIGGKYYWEDWGVYEEIELSDEETNTIYDYYYLEME